MDLGAQFEKEAIEAFDYWKAKQLALAIDPKIIDDLTNLTVEMWIRRILRQPVYESLGEKRANINDPGSFFQPAEQSKP